MATTRTATKKDAMCSNCAPSYMDEVKTVFFAGFAGGNHYENGDITKPVWRCGCCEVTEIPRRIRRSKGKMAFDKPKQERQS